MKENINLVYYKYTIKWEFSESYGWKIEKKCAVVW